MVRQTQQSNKMKKPIIIIDDKIPFIKGAFDGLADVKYLNGSQIHSTDVRDADALIVRTRTRCDENLLKNSSVKFISTATIGFDHIDAEYCQKNNIVWTNSAGCNADSVKQYVASALFFLQKKMEIELEAKTIGIVGVGNVGKRVAEFCKTIGMKVLLNDPPRQRTEKNNSFVSLNEIAEKCDIISFHTPLNMSGEDKTFHLADNDFFSTLKKNPVIINAARGEICETQAMKWAKDNQLISGLVIDCWENEPNIDAELLQMADIATPHIAGYSADGKANATTFCVQSVSRFFGLGIDDWQVKKIPQPDNTTIIIDSLNKKEILSTAIFTTYDISTDSLSLKNNPRNFEGFRSDYPLRREFPTYTICLKNNQPAISNLIAQLGFQLKA
jgi:erythronate-4-phosphate dehydrogenase